MKNINAGTVALIAHGMIQDAVKRGDLDQTDFSTYTIPAQGGKTYLDRTLEKAARSAWQLVQKVEELRPVE